MVISKLVELKNINTELVICPTLRETGGLAMSSRNARLDAAERKLAFKIYETLLLVKHEIKKGSLDELKIKAVTHLSSFGFKTDYVEIANASTLALEQNWDGKNKLVVLIAAYLNDVRLIDNLVLN